MIIQKLKSVFAKKPNPMLAKKIEEIGLSARTYHCLRRAGIGIVGDLVQLSRNDIKGIRGAVRRTCVEVEEVLEGLELWLRKG